jgi:hypothetical protein
VAIDGAVTAAMALVYAAEFSDPPYLPGIPAWAAAAAALAVLPAAVRRRWPRAALALVVTGGAVLTALSTSVGPPLAGSGRLSASGTGRARSSGAGRIRRGSAP